MPRSPATSTSTQYGAGLAAPRSSVRAGSCGNFRDATRPSQTSGFFGINPTRSRARGGTDSTSFNEAGLPGIGISQDPIEYNSHTWHTNLDTYERVIEQDAQESAMVIASAVYHLAMRDEMLPRFSKEAMPALPGR
ncbi:MAG: M28 family peptidase [Vicinamibacterales bacterium]